MSQESERENSEPYVETSPDDWDNRDIHGLIASQVSSQELKAYHKTNDEGSEYVPSQMCTQDWKDCNYEIDPKENIDLNLMPVSIVRDDTEDSDDIDDEPYLLPLFSSSECEVLDESDCRKKKHSKKKKKKKRSKKKRKKKSKKKHKKKHKKKSSKKRKERNNDEDEFGTKEDAAKKHDAVVMDTVQCTSHSELSIDDNEYQNEDPNPKKYKSYPNLALYKPPNKKRRVERSLPTPKASAFYSNDMFDELLNDDDNFDSGGGLTQQSKKAIDLNSNDIFDELLNDDDNFDSGGALTQQSKKAIDLCSNDILCELLNDAQNFDSRALTPQSAEFFGGVLDFGNDVANDDCGDELQVLKQKYKTENDDAEFIEVHNLVGQPMQQNNAEEFIKVDNLVAQPMDQNNAEESIKVEDQITENEPDGYGNIVHAGNFISK